MNETNNPKLKSFSQKLRREMTKEERRLWYDFLRSLQVTVNRQKVIGAYIVDFYIASAKLVIELDGSQHFGEEKIASDQKRDQCLKDLGFKVLRYFNADVNKHFEAVCEEILGHIKPSP